MTEQREINIDTLPGRILWLVEHTKEASDWENIRFDKDFIKICELPNNSYISDLRSGNISSPSFNIAWRIIRALGVSPVWLAEGKGYPFPDNQVLDTETGQISIQYLRDELRSHKQQLQSLTTSTERMIELIDRLMQSPDYSRNETD